MAPAPPRPPPVRPTAEGRRPASTHRLDRIPLLILMLGLTGVLMLVPMGHALGLRDFPVARAFGYSSVLVTGVSVLLGLATWRAEARLQMRGLLPMLGAIYIVVPAAMAVPLAEAVPELRPVDAWFEMVSSFTTTGASLLDTPRRLSDPIHLWRAMAGWAGGLFVLVSAVAFLAPLRLGGYELLRPDPVGATAFSPSRAIERQRLRAALSLALPWYAGLTLAVWLALAVAGMPGLPALILSMSALSTSGILPRETLGTIGFGAEAVLMLAMMLSLSRGFSLPGETPRLRRGGALLKDPEMRAGLVAVLVVTLIVVARHWQGAFVAADGEDLPALGSAAWGAAFTGLSFLTTTGFVSHDWIVSRAWSGLTPPGLVLMGLALVGGGVATTAGGVKLLRILAMARMGRSELERMINPSVVDRGSDYARFLAHGGARAAWLFAMVFAIVAVALVGVVMAFGSSLETALIFVIAALTTTGPLVQVAGESALGWSGLGDPARFVLALAMILGRLEILVILALAMGQIARD
jgi:trk system potassium uptake protein